MIKEIPNFRGYFVNTEGEVFKQKKNGELRKVSSSIENTYGFSRVNLVNDEGKAGARLLHRIVYKTFKGEYTGDLVFIDGNKQNCRLDNLITVKELLDFYTRHHYYKEG